MSLICYNPLMLQDQDPYLKYQGVAEDYGISRAQAVLMVRGQVDTPESVLTQFPTESIGQSLLTFGRQLDRLDKTNWKMIEARSKEKILFDQLFEDRFKDWVDDDQPGVEHAFSVAARMSYVAARWGLDPNLSNIEHFASNRQVDIIAEAAKRSAFEIQDRDTLATRGYSFPYSGMFLIDHKQSRGIVGVDMVSWDDRLELERREIRARRITSGRFAAVFITETVGKELAICGGIALMLLGMSQGNWYMEGGGIAVAVAGSLITNIGINRWESRWYTDFEKEKLGADRRFESIRILDEN